MSDIEFVQFPTPFCTPYNEAYEETPNYEPYDIFVTTNEISLLLQDIMTNIPNIGMNLFPVDISENGSPISSTLYVRLTRGTDYLDRSEITDEQFNIIQSGLKKIFIQDKSVALIWTNSSSLHRPIGWLSNVISCVKIPDDIFVRTEIDQRRIKIYGRFDPISNSEYMNTYETIHQNINDQIDILWEKGTVYVPNSQLTRMETNWYLDRIGPSINGDGYIMQARWTVPIHYGYGWRPTEFLLSVVNNPEEHIEFDIGFNMVIHFGLAHQLHLYGYEIHFDSSHVFVKINNLAQLQLIALCIQKAQTYSGNVIPLTARTEKEHQEYITAVVEIAGADNLNRKGQIVNLRRRAHHESYVTLVKLDGQLHPQQLRQAIEEQVQRIRAMVN